MCLTEKQTAAMSAALRTIAEIIDQPEPTVLPSEQTPLTMFLAEETYAAPGEAILFRDFYAALCRFCDSKGITRPTKCHVSKTMPADITVGIGYANRKLIGNMALTRPIEVTDLTPYTSIDGRLRRDYAQTAPESLPAGPLRASRRKWADSV